MFYALAVAFALLGLACIFSVALGLPGTWMLLGLAVLLELTDHTLLQQPEAVTFGWWLLGGIGLLALLGEGIEIVTSALGAKHGGGTDMAMAGSFVGGMLGGLLLTFTLPIPVVGTLAGVLIGTFLGALVGELHATRGTVKGSLKPALGATLGRVIGTVGKVGVGLAAWGSLTVAAFIA